MSKHRILFIAEAVTLAHVGRMALLAQSLCECSGYEVCLAADPRYDKLLGGFQGARRSVSSISGQAFSQAIAAGKPIYDTATLERYVQDDLACIGDWNPDVVVGDFRLSLAVSAPLAGKPYAALTNAHWSPFANIPMPVPDIAMTRFLPINWAQGLFDMVRPLIFSHHALPLNRVRKRHGLHTLGMDLRTVYTYGDYTLYADLPEVVAMHALPPNHLFLGPVLWSPSLPVPEWWHAVPRDRPIVYVTLGSSGDAHLLPVVLQALADMPVHVIASAAGKSRLFNIPANAWLADFLPGDQACAVADAVICNGGSATVYQALAAGKPVLGLPGNLDQYLTMSCVERTGAGLLLRSGRVSAMDVYAAIARLLAEETHANAARKLMDSIARHPAPARFTAFLERSFGWAPGDKLSAESA